MDNQELALALLKYREAFELWRKSDEKFRQQEWDEYCKRRDEYLKILPIDYCRTFYPAEKIAENKDYLIKNQYWLN